MATEFPLKSEQNLPESKILSYEAAVAKIKECREKGLRVIMAQGVFDVVHIGHIEYFRQAKSAGDILIVGIENDDSVRLNKGDKRPFNNLGDRLEFLTEFKSIDFVFSFPDVPNYSQDFDMFTRRFVALSPTAVAITSWDPNSGLKKTQAKEAGIEVVLVDHEHRNSSIRVLQAIGYE